LFLKETHKFIRGNQNYIEINNGFNRLLNKTETIEMVNMKGFDLLFPRINSWASNNLFYAFQ